MPKRAAARSVEQLAFTDHAIPRRPTPPSTQTAQALREFWTGQSNPRDTALAYAAANLDAAYPLLEEAAKTNPKDVPLLLQLAQYHERGNAEEKAEKLYAQILLADPANTTAAVNLGTYKIRQGNAKEAMASPTTEQARNSSIGVTIVTTNAPPNVRAKSGATNAQTTPLARRRPYPKIEPDWIIVASPDI
jgi:tetratricopeptide (TPR) repeat protein